MKIRMCKEGAMEERDASRDSASSHLGQWSPSTHRTHTKSSISLLRLPCAALHPQSAHGFQPHHRLELAIAAATTVSPATTTRIGKSASTAAEKAIHTLMMTDVVAARSLLYCVSTEDPRKATERPR